MKLSSKQLCHSNSLCAQVFVEDMMEHPNNGYALLGVSRALRALGRDADAAQMEGVHQVCPSCVN